MRIAFAIARILSLPVLWLVSSSASAQATAEPPASTTGAVGARLQYTRDDAASRCPEPSALQDAVSSQLGYPVFEREPITHQVSVQIAAQKRGLRAQIEVRKSDGTPLGSRAIESPSSTCEELSSALVLAIGIALDPTRWLAPRAPAPKPSIVGCPAPTVCPVCPVQQATDTESPFTPPPAPPEPVEEPSSFRNFGISAGIGLGAGALPAISSAGLIDLSARWTSAGIHLTGVAHPSASGGGGGGGASADGLSPPGDAVEGQLLLGQLAVCGLVPLHARLDFGACALGSLGSLRGIGTASGARDASATAAAGAQVRLSLEVAGPLFAEASADLQANLVRTELYVDSSVAWTTPAFWGGLGLALGIHFP